MRATSRDFASMVASADQLEGLDPLEPAEGYYSSAIVEAQKRDVLNILRSYTGTFDVFAEAIQNAIDAVDLKKRGDDGFEPHIWIKINLRDSTLRFVDNGIGMDVGQLGLFLRPSVSFKADKGVRGHKGVGATFLAYGYSSFNVYSKVGGKGVGVTLTGGRQWAESTTENIPRPRFRLVEVDVPELAASESGTCVEVVIGSHRDERPNLSWLAIEDPQIWHKVLRIKSPLGGVYLKTGGIKPNYHITVVHPDGRLSSFHGKPLESEFYYPHQFAVCQRNKDLKELSNVFDKKKPDVQPPPDFRSLDCIWNIWDQDELLDPDGGFYEHLSEDQRSLIVKHDVHVYGCFVRSRTVWDTFQHDELQIRPQIKIIQGGLQLASDYMVQGDLFTIPLTTAAGYQANAFIIVHFTGGNPDMGRKVFQPELKEIADILSRRVVAELRRYQPALKPDTGATFTNPSRALDDWRDGQKDWQKRNPLSLEIEGQKLALISEPREEQDVIALFHQLVGMKVLRGLRFYSTGYNTRYDGLYYYRYERGDEFQLNQNFWGVDPARVPSESGALVLEYKYTLDALIDDFEKDDKNPKEINFCVCWDFGDDYRRMFTASSLVLGQEGGTRETFGATHALYVGIGKGSKMFEVLCLRDFILFFQDPASLLAKHKTHFG